MKWKQAVGKVLHERRKAAGMTQFQLCGMAKFSASTTQLSTWERGMALPRLDTLAKFAAALGVPAYEMIAEAEALVSEAAA